MERMKNQKKLKETGMKTKKIKEKPNQQIVRGNIQSKSRFIYMIVIIFLIIIFAGIFIIITEYKKFAIHHEMENLRRELVNLRSAMNIDSVRQFKLQKIINIINEYNPELSSAEKYDIANQIYEMSFKYTNMNIDLLCAIITHESANTWDPNIVSPAGAMGLMQIMPVTGMFLAKSEELEWTSPKDVLFDPVYNIRLGTRYLSSLINRYGLEGGLAAYNGGERQASLWLANDCDDQYLWKETREYIPAIQQLYLSYSNHRL